MLDLAALYSPSNDAMLARMMQNIFTQQPRYNDDLLTVMDKIVVVSRDCGTAVNADDYGWNIPWINEGYK